MAAPPPPPQYHVTPLRPPPRPRDLGRRFPGAVTITHLLPGACGALGCARVTSVCRCTRGPGCVPAVCGGMGGCPLLACWAGRGGAGRMLPAGRGLCRAVGETDHVCSHSGQARVTVLGRVSAARELSSRHCCRLARCGITLRAWAVDTEGASWPPLEPRRENPSEGPPRGPVGARRASVLQAGIPRTPGASSRRPRTPL